ncbi:MAG: hypothetical protein Kow0059_09300 [Candidatus Sumerlaeia bacterium]
MLKKRFAFTLIELLIVVAIIAILAAIAVPNFLEAQVRSKVSRARADLRSIATALESYFADNNHYPPNPDSSPPNPVGHEAGFNVTPWRLTTPIAYITTRPLDPFKTGKDVTEGNNPQFQHERFYYDYYEIISLAEFTRLAGRGVEVFAVAVDAGNLPAGANRYAFQKYGKWLQWSAGPDGLLWNKTDDFTGFATLKPMNTAYRPWGYSFDVPYDPTNGTVSFGNIIRSQINTEGTMPIPTP